MRLWVLRPGPVLKEVSQRLLVEIGEWGSEAGKSQPSPIPQAPPWCRFCCAWRCLPLLPSIICSLYINGDQKSSSRPALMGQCGEEKEPSPVISQSCVLAIGPWPIPLNLTELRLPYVSSRESASSPCLPQSLVMKIKQKRARLQRYSLCSLRSSLFSQHSFCSHCNTFWLNNCFLLPRRGF